MPLKSIFFVAGEASGDVQAAQLVKALRKRDPNLSIHCMGGDKMAEAGALLDIHYKKTSVMGLWDVIRKLPSIRRTMKDCLKQIELSKAGNIVLVDYPGFNLRLAKKLKKKGLDITYFIPPKVWAWNKSRIRKIKRYVDRVVCILPFEQRIYREASIPFIYHGNPLFDSCREAMNRARESEKAQSSLPDYIAEDGYVALLPGSRPKEVERILPEMIELVKMRPDLKFKLSAMSHLNSSLYKDAISAGIEPVIDNSYELLANSRAAVLASGTASLEAALMNIPHIVVYKIDGLSFSLGKLLVKLKHVSLVNLILEKRAVPELLQRECKVVRINHELEKILTEEGAREQQVDFEMLAVRLGPEGVADRLASGLLSIFQ